VPARHQEIGEKSARPTSVGPPAANGTRIFTGTVRGKSDWACHGWRAGGRQNAERAQADNERLRNPP